MAASKAAALGQRLAVSSQNIAKKSITIATPHLATFWKYARTDLAPPSPAKWNEIRRGFQDLVVAGLSGRFLDCTVKQATRNALVFAEVCCWFYVGEMIGRRSIIGYNV
ncbi:ATP synthase subunit g, mitochondrial-like [Oscarella lobularis]|uniref:ATP synthase subunit g, mitochondrial-like n=1 Tax=Oscarella lobularis TaxID=121494 RepID=UPI00331383AD